MEGKKSVKNNNKKLLVYGVVAVVAIVVVIILISSLGKGGTKGGNVYTNVGDAQWMTTKQTLNFTDGSNKGTFTITTDDNLVKQEGEYEYTVSYTLTVNDKEYTGTHRFGNGYSVHNEDNNIPYSVDIMDFEDNSIQVRFLPVVEDNSVQQ